MSKAFLPLLAAALVGCSTSASFVPVNPAPGPMRPKPPEQVEVFLFTTPTRPFVAVGLITAQQERYSSDSTSVILHEARKLAGRVGCDALMVSAPNNKAVGNQYLTWTLKGYTSACIVFTDTSRTETAAATKIDR